jgi:hypothetical protein
MRPPGPHSSVLLLLAASAFAKPLEIASAHYQLWTTAPPARAKQALEAAEALHSSWTAWASPGKSAHVTRHKLRLFASRDEMRRALPGLHWAEAIYHDGLCDQYDDRFAEKPWQWLVHEATHQLAHEDSRLLLPRWANEGLACLFNTSRIAKGRVILGSVEPETYPVWWLRRTPPSGNMERDLRNGLLVAPSTILEKETDAVDIHLSVNAHYMSWWSLAHFLNATDSVAWKDWILRDGTRRGFAKRFGSARALDAKWYAHVLALTDSARKH